MNVKQLTATAEALQNLGFDEIIKSKLAKRAVLKTSSFIIQHRVIRGNDVIKFELYFEKEAEADVYTCMYYDAILRKELKIEEIRVNEVDIQWLEQRMFETEWASLYLDDSSSIADKDFDWQEFERVESIIEDLRFLSETEEGRRVAEYLKFKFWCDTPMQDYIANINSIKNKLEISQRFYMVDSQPVISVEECYRFLCNRWLEKQMVLKKKLNDSESEQPQESSDLNKTKLHQKRRGGRKIKSKR